MHTCLQHIAVMHRQFKMVDWLMEHGAKPSIKAMNRKGLTPFTLSVWLGYVDMYQHIALNYLSEVLWKYGNSQLQFIDLEQIDSFRMEEYDEDAHELTQIQTPNPTQSQSEGFNSRSSQASSKASIKKEGLDNSKDLLHGLPGWRSAFEIIVHKELEQFTQESIFEYLIDTKWSAFGQWIYLGCIVCTYIALLVLYYAATLLRMQHLMHDPPFPPQYGLAAFHDTSGIMFLVLASVGCLMLLVMSWALMRVRFRDLDQDHNGQISMEEVRMFVFKNLTSASFLTMAGLLWAIAAARHYGDHDMVRCPPSS